LTGSFGGVTHAHYSLDEHEPVNGKVSQRISLEGDPATLGIAQDGIHVRKGATDALSVYLRSEKPGLTVIARVRNPEGSVLAEASLMPGNAVNGWRPEAVAAIKALKLFTVCIYSE
jgi:hypothetical protein